MIALHRDNKSVSNVSTTFLYNRNLIPREYNAVLPEAMRNPLALITPVKSSTKRYCTTPAILLAKIHYKRKALQFDTVFVKKKIFAAPLRHHIGNNISLYFTPSLCHAFCYSMYMCSSHSDISDIRKLL